MPSQEGLPKPSGKPGIAFVDCSLLQVARKDADCLLCFTLLLGEAEPKRRGGFSGRSYRNAAESKQTSDCIPRPESSALPNGE